MKLRYTTQALNIYCKQTGNTLAQVAEKAGISYSAVNRYAREERLPDIDNLLRICNALHIRVDNFFIHPDIELTSVTVFLPEEWTDILFRYDRIEAVRLEKQLNKTEFVDRINAYGTCNITRNTYNNLITGTHCEYGTVLGLIGSLDIELDYLFEQPVKEADDDSILISRKRLTEMKRYITKLENDYRELLLKNKRLEKKALPRYQERMENMDAKKIIRDFVRRFEREFADLKSWIEEDDDIFQPSPSIPYGEIKNKTGLVADGGNENADNGTILV